MARQVKAMVGGGEKPKPVGPDPEIQRQLAAAKAAEQQRAAAATAAKEEEQEQIKRRKRGRRSLFGSGNPGAGYGDLNNTLGG